VSVFKRLTMVASAVLLGFVPGSVLSQDWAQVDEEVLEHFRTMVRMDTTDPPGREIELTKYLVSVLENEGIEVDVYALEPDRPNVMCVLAFPVDWVPKHFASSKR